MNNKGFTLIEILIALLLVSALAVLASTSFFTLLKGAVKSETLKEVKQNGEYAIGVLELKIRNARSIGSTCDGSIQSSIQIQNPDQTTTTFSCVTDAQAGVRRLRQSTGGVNTYLTNTQVTISQNCNTPNVSFTCTTDAIDGKSKTVAVSFILSQANAAAPVPEQATETFRTEVALRNK